MKNMKKFASLLLVLLMVVCMAAPCYAVNTEETPNRTQHTITVNKTDNQSDCLLAYQIFRGDITGDRLTNVTWGTGVMPDRTSLINDLMEAGIIPSDFLETVAEENRAQAIAEIVAGMENDSEELDAFAAIVAQHLSGIFVTNYNNDTMVVTGDGYYLFMNYVSPYNQPLGDAYTKYILKVAGVISVTPKRDAPSLEKDIVGGEETDATYASIGDSITFQLSSTIPEMDGYDKYYYIIHDTLSEGLTFNNDIVVTMNGQELVAYTDGQSYENSDYYVEYENGSIKVVFIDFLQYKGTSGNITVTYSATLNNNAVITDKGNPNTAWLEYSNNPNYDHDGDADNTPDDPSDDITPPPTGETPPSESIVYTTALQLNKISSVDGSALTGAKFKIEGQSSGIYVINETVFQNTENGTWYRLTDGTYTETAPTEDTANAYESTTTKYAKVTVTKETTSISNLVNEGWVDANGIMTFTGLGEGTYTITELVAPEGYNLLQSPITVEIIWNGTNQSQMWTVNASVNNGSEIVEAELVNNRYSFDVVNQAGVELPSTGGIGTTIFYITGAVLALAAFVLLVTKKRMTNNA